MKETITVKYVDKLFNKESSFEFPLKGQLHLLDNSLAKYAIFKENKQLIEDKAPNSKEQIIHNSIEYQVLSIHTAFICKIKELDEKRIP